MYSREPTMHKSRSKLKPFADSMQSPNSSTHVPSSSCDQPPSAVRRNWLVLLLYVGLTILMTLPLITRLGSHIPAAEGSDVWVHEWTFWWIERALLNFQNPFYTDLLFHPTGVSLTTHNIAWFNIGVWFPLQAAVGNTVAYSLTYILIFTLNAFCMYLLTFAWTRSRSAAIIAGIIYGFWPYTFTQSGHPNMATIMWPPLALFYLKRIVDWGFADLEIANQGRAFGSSRNSGSWHNVVMAGLFIALTGIARWQLLLVVSLLFGIYLLYLWVTPFFSRRNSQGQISQGQISQGQISQGQISQGQAESPSNATITNRWSSWLNRAWRLALPFTIAAVLMLPLGGPVIYTQLTQDFPEEVLVYEPWFGTPLLTYLIPNSRLGFYSAIVEQLSEHLQFHYQRVDFLGYTVLLLALFGIVWLWRKTWIWLLIALFYWALALGPELTLAYERLPELPMPYRLVEDFSLVRIVRRPHRFNAFVALPLGLMAGYGVTVLLNSPLIKRGPKLLTVLLPVLLSGLILAEYRPSPYGLESTHIPAWYGQLAEDPEEFAIFGLPPSLRLADKYFMHYQIEHEKPMVEGHISRPTNATFAFMDQSDYLWHLRIHRTMKEELVDVSNQLQLLVNANVRYLILHKYLLTDEQLAQFIDWLTYEPLYEDDALLVYYADPQLDRDFTISEWLTEELGLIGLAFGVEQVRQGDVIRMDVRLGSRGTMASDYSACIVLLDEAGTLADHSCHPIGGERTTSVWQPNEIVRGDYAMRIAPLLEPMAYNAELVLINSVDRELSGSDLMAAALYRRSIGMVNVEGLERQFTRPVLSHQATFTWSDQIRLSGFDVASSPNTGGTDDTGGADDTEAAGESGITLQVTLAWQALQRMNNSYKVFVHIVDESTGALVAQNDSIPRKWAYPTTWWEAGEYVEDTIELITESLPEGPLRILIGIYDEETGVRLPVVDADGTQYPDDAAVLTVLE